MELLEQNFQEIIKEDRVLVDFYAVWCGPCKMQSVVLKELEDEVTILKVDTDKHEDIAREYGIMSIPTLILFEKGEIKQKNVGFTSAEEIRTWLK